MVLLSDVAVLLDQKVAPILIMDKDDSLVHLLQQENYHVLRVETEEKALEILKNHTISILITYHKGPASIEFLKKLNEPYPSLERILIGDAILNEPVQPIQFLVRPSAREVLLSVLDRFAFFQLRYEHALLKAELLSQNTLLKETKNGACRDLAAGKQIHKTLLLDRPPGNVPGVNLAVSSLVSNSLDGDFISFFRPADHLMDFAIGDVMGKGLAAALIGTAIKGEIARFAQGNEERSVVFDHHHFWHENIASIKEIIQQVHHSYIEQLLNLEIYVSLFYGRLDLDKRTLTFIDCGFTKPIYYRKSSQKAMFIRASNFPLGIVPKHEYFPFEVHFEEGDFFVFYSDGIIESASKEGELYGEKRLGQIIEYYHDLTPDLIIEKVRQSMVAFTGKEVLEDDFTLFIIHIDQLCPPTPSRSGVAKFNSVLNQLEAVRNFTKELCCKAPGNLERLSSEMQLAVDEIFTNIVIHGYKNKPGFPICINRVYLPSSLVIEIADQADPFDPFDVSPINLFGDQDHGYGWHLIRQIADRVVYTPKKTKNGWNRLSIFKNYYTKRTNVMEFTPIEQNGALIIQLDSETLDAKQVPEFKENMIQILDTKGIDYVIFDLHKLQFIDSSGLGAFLSLFRHLSMKGGHLSLAAMNRSVKTIFELVSMQKIFDCHETLAIAVSAKEKNKK